MSEKASIMYDKSHLFEQEGKGCEGGQQDEGAYIESGCIEAFVLRRRVDPIESLPEFQLHT